MIHLILKTINQEEENTYFWIQKIEDTTNKTLTSKKRELCLEQSQLLQCANPSIIPNEACLQTPQMLPPTSSSSSSTKVPDSCFQYFPSLQHNDSVLQNHKGTSHQSPTTYNSLLIRSHVLLLSVYFEILPTFKFGLLLCCPLHQDIL